MIFPFDYAAGRASLDAEVAELRQQVTLLRNTIEGASQIITFEGAPYYLLGIYDRDEALDATKEQ